MYCSKPYVHGGKDTLTDRFYCEACWGMFQTSRTFAAGAPPPPPDATFSVQVSTRVFSLLIDAVCSGKGASNDILDLCAGASVVRKWASAQVQRYVAIENDRAAVDDLADHRPQAARKSVRRPTATRLYRARGSHCSRSATATVPRRDLFPRSTPLLRLRHVRDVLFRISNALVPNGVF